MTESAPIVVEKVGKRFRMRGHGTPTLKSAVLGMIAPGAGRRSDFWALRDVSFSLARGETLGIIGVNGAGKSTLLSLLAGTKTTTEGRIVTRGKISSLLELGAGFHPDLTGRENVFLAGAIMGLSKKQMRARFDDIVAFAEIADFIDQPVKHYSSGMYVRLGFAVAVEVDPDILLVDEVLAVGDVRFHRKCIERMRSFRDQGKTMLIISHDLGVIQKVSDRILVLDDGQVTGIGDPEQMVGDYRALAGRKSSAGLGREWGTGEVQISAVTFLNGAGEETAHLQWGEPFEVRLRYAAKRRIADPVFGFAVSDATGTIVYGSNTQIEEHGIAAVEGNGEMSLRFENLPLASGAYLFSFSVHSADHKTNYHRLDNRYTIAVHGGRSVEGACYIPVQWGMRT